MRKSLLFGAMLLIASCTVYKEEEIESPIQHRYHAVAEETVDAETRVYADSKLRVRWNEGDHISIFERNTYNQEFEFLGDTGDTAGDFDPVESGGYHSSGDIEDGHVYAVYPYDNDNKCDYDGKLTVEFPSTQHYKKDSFGVGANVMFAKTNTMDLRFMHVGGYRTFKLYGEGMSVSSVRIESKGSEYLSGRTDVVIGEDGTPTVSFIESSSNSKSVELVCDTPVSLGATASEAVEFWFVLPPGTLTQGFTVTVTDVNGNEFSRSTSNSIEIKSGVKKSMPAFEVEIEDEPAGSDTEFNEDAYITYGAKHESWFLGSNQYINDTYFIGATGTRFEMKFQIPSYTLMPEVTLASKSGERYNDAFKVTRNSVFYRIETKNDQVDTDLTSNFIDGTSVIVLSASCGGSQVTATVNGNEKTVYLALDSFDLGYLFSNYYHDNDEGSYTAFSTGVPDGAKLYYVKIWNGDDLVYFGHAASATCPFSSNIEHCWYEEVSQQYTFARELTMPSNADPGYGNTSNATVRQPFGGGVDVDVPVTGITLNKTSIAFTEVGETDQLTATVTPSDATISTVTWSSSDNTVATVRPDGTVTAVGDGSAIIIATANDGSGVTAECRVTVGNIVFADEKVKSICVSKWDTNGDGELSYVEAEAVTSIKSGVFSSNKDIVTFNELQYFINLPYVDDLAFSGCTNLTSIRLPESVTSLGQNSFSSCNSLTSISLPDRVISIYSEAFSGCSALTEIKISDNSRLQVLDGMVFYNCTSLKRISLPKSVHTLITQNTTNGVLEGAFYKSCIEEIEIYDNLLEHYAHYNRLNYYDVYGSQLRLSFFLFYPTEVYNSQNTLKRVFVKKTGESDDTVLCRNAFTDFSSLEIVSLPDSVTEIGDYGFKGCSSLSSITIPDSVTTIGISAFSGCSGLSFIKVLSSNVPIGGVNMFYGTSCFIYVPDDLVTQYKEADNWNEYASRIVGMNSFPE